MGTPRRNTASMNEALDFRSDKMDSLEGLGVAPGPVGRLPRCHPRRGVRNDHGGPGKWRASQEFPSWVHDDISEGMIEDSRLFASGSRGISLAVSRT